MRAEVTTAISFDPVRGVAGIAGTLRGGRVVSIDIVRATDKLSAHALAVLRQVEISAKARCSAATIITPSSLLIACLAGEVDAMGEQAHRLVRELEDRLGALGEKVELHAAGEDGTRRAYIAARQGYKAWLAGVEAERETWSPEPAVEEMRSAA